MSCCGIEIKTARNEDLRITYTPAPGYSFASFTGRMQVRAYEGAPDPPLLNVSMSPTANGSVIEVLDTSLVLTVKKADLMPLPTATSVSDPAVFAYDMVITDQNGFNTRLVYGQFILFEGVVR